MSHIPPIVLEPHTWNLLAVSKLAHVGWAPEGARTCFHGPNKAPVNNNHELLER